jgi:hypothetical protein
VTAKRVTEGKIEDIIWKGDEEEDVGSHWMTLRKRRNTEL